MRIRKALPEDVLRGVRLAESLDLGYPGMEKDELWVAEEGRIVGLVVLKKHPDCLELCALGVDSAHRGKGVARALVQALVAAAPGPVHLATVMPEFFEACSFERTADVPQTFIDRRQTDWCEGCDKSQCTVMLRRTS